MRVDEFDYYLPPHLIAQTPLEKRSDSRLMVVNRRTGIKTPLFLPNRGFSDRKRLFGNQRYQSLPVAVSAKRPTPRPKSKCFCLGKSKKIPGKL